MKLHILMTNYHAPYTRFTYIGTFSSVTSGSVNPASNIKLTFLLGLKMNVNNEHMNANNEQSSEKSELF